MPEPEGHLSQSTQRSSVKAGSKNISHKKRKGRKRGNINTLRILRLFAANT